MSEELYSLKAKKRARNLEFAKAVLHERYQRIKNQAAPSAWRRFWLRVSSWLNG